MWEILITITGVTAVILMWLVLYDSNRFVVRHYDVEDDRIKQPFRAVVLADLHNKQYGRDNKVLLSAIEEQKPDAVLIAGDILTAKPGEKLDKSISFLKALAERYPVYYANGNHEHRIKLYPDEYGTMAEEYEKALHDMGIDRLVNAHAVLENCNLTIYGAEIERKYYQRFHVIHMEEDYMEHLLGAPSPERFNILIAHNPDYFPQYAAWGADLVLSGHVHGGMVRIPGGRGMVSPAVKFFPKYDGGLFCEGKSKMLLSRGLGMHTIPVRLFNPGEVLVVDFAAKE